MQILAIDPGPTESAYVLWDGERILRHDKTMNALLCDAITTKLLTPDHLVVEKIASYGMPVGEEVFETVWWSGRFCQAFYAHLMPAWRITRGEIKLHLCNTKRAKDANVRQALIDRLGPPGTKKAPGATYGIHADEWAALAVAVTWWDKYRSKYA